MNMHFYIQISWSVPTCKLTPLKKNTCLIFKMNDKCCETLLCTFQGFNFNEQFFSFFVTFLHVRIKSKKKLFSFNLNGYIVIKTNCQNISDWWKLKGQLKKYIWQNIQSKTVFMWCIHSKCSDKTHLHHIDVYHEMYA